MNELFEQVKDIVITHNKLVYGVNMDTKEDLREVKSQEKARQYLDSLNWFEKGEEIKIHDLESEFLANLIELSYLKPDSFLPTSAAIDVFSESISKTVWQDAINKTLNDNIKLFVEE